MNIACRRILVAFFLVSLSIPAGAFDLASYRVVDLGHAYGDETLYWPSRPAARFELQQLADGETPRG